MVKHELRRAGDHEQRRLLATGLEGGRGVLIKAEVIDQAPGRPGQGLGAPVVVCKLVDRGVPVVEPEPRQHVSSGALRQPDALVGVGGDGDRPGGTGHPVQQVVLGRSGVMEHIYQQVPGVVLPPLLPEAGVLVQSPDRHRDEIVLVQDFLAALLLRVQPSEVEPKAFLGVEWCCDGVQGLIQPVPAEEFLDVPG